MAIKIEALFQGVPSAVIHEPVQYGRVLFGNAIDRAKGRYIPEHERSKVKDSALGEQASVIDSRVRAMHRERGQSGIHWGHRKSIGY